MDDEADAWFYDLGAVARRVEANERADARNRRRVYVIAAFVLFAFLALGWRIQGNVDAIRDGQERDRQDRYLSCVAGVAIIEKFNTQNDRLAETEAANPLSDPQVRDQRVRIYADAKILPVPVCEQP
jgi:ABC-type lipoprotein release transport system permease subunit